MPLGPIETILSMIPFIRRVPYRLDLARAEIETLQQKLNAATQPSLCPSKDHLHLLMDWLKEQGHPDLDQVHSFNGRTRDDWVSGRAATVSAGSELLDVGAGTAPYKHLFAHCAYKSHDFAKYDGYKGPEGTYTEIDLVSDITDIPVPDNTFDVVLCTEVLEHVPRPVEALAEMVRITRTGGRLFITAPLGSGLHQEPYHFYGGYTNHWYQKFLNDFGCEIISIEPNHGFLAHLSQECARFSWKFNKYGQYHGEFADDLSTLVGDVLARYFYALDKKVLIPEFTVGFHVEARKL